MSRRGRYVLTDQQAWLSIFGNPELRTFKENYRRLIDETTSQGQVSSGTGLDGKHGRWQKEIRRCR